MVLLYLQNKSSNTNYSDLYFLDFSLFLSMCIFYLKASKFIRQYKEH